MSTSSRVMKPTAEELPLDIAELKAALAELPEQYRGRFEVIVTRVVDSTKRRRRIMNLVQDALSQLRLDMKYMLFDLEATRRERDEYRAQLDGE